MLLISYNPVSSTKRWKKIATIWHPKNRISSNFLKYKTHHRGPTGGSFTSSGLRRRGKTQLWDLFITRPLLFPCVAVSYAFSAKPLREFFLAKTLYNSYKLFPFTEGVYPGFILNSSITNLLVMKEFASQILILEHITLNNIISFVFNAANTKMTFAKSSGCNAYRRKNIKKTKLVYVQLPSDKLVVLTKSTFCVLGTNLDLQLDKVIEGKWGQFTRCTKRISVRGVAKNPVDHPNGGRTKAKQPELSPWGWIAKLNK